MGAQLNLDLGPDERLRAAYRRCETLRLRMPFEVALAVPTIRRLLEIAAETNTIRRGHAKEKH